MIVTRRKPPRRMPLLITAQRVGIYPMRRTSRTTTVVTTSQISAATP
jgi:hypothetical protein